MCVQYILLLLTFQDILLINFCYLFYLLNITNGVEEGEEVATEGKRREAGAGRRSFASLLNVN